MIVNPHLFEICHARKAAAPPALEMCSMGVDVPESFRRADHAPADLDSTSGRSPAGP